MKSYMYTAGVLVAGLATSLAIPVANGDSEYVVTVQTHTDSNSQQTTLLSKDESKIYASACSNTLNTGALKDHVISAKLDSDGSGTITIGSQTYQVHEDHAISGGISCGRMFSADEHYVSCEITLPDSLGVSKTTAKDAACFGDKDVLFHQHGAGVGNGLNAPHPAPSEVSKSRRAVPFGKRQYECDSWTDTTEVYEKNKGDGGAPHQSYVNKQLSVRTDGPC